MSKKKKDKKNKRSVAKGSQKRRERANQDYSSMFVLPEGKETFSIKSDGVKRIDVVPYIAGKGNPNADEGDLHYEREFWAHRNIGVNNDMVVCPAGTFDKPCPICELRDELRQSGDSDKKVIDALNRSRRMLLNVRDMKEDATKVKIWHVSNWYFGRALDTALEAAYEDEDDNMNGFCDPDDGHFLKCVAEPGYEGAGFNISRVDFVRRKEDLDDAILGQAICLDDIIVSKTYDELKEMLNGAEDDDDDDKKDKKKDKKDKKKDADDDDDDDKKDKKKNKKKDDDDDKKPDLAGMDEDELLEYMKDNDLKIKGYKKMDEDELRDAVEELVTPEKGAKWSEKDDGSEVHILLKEMDEEELVEYMEENDLKIKGYKKMDEDELRDAIEELVTPEKQAKEDLTEMDEDELLEYMKDKDLKIKGYKKMDEDELRDAIVEALED